MHRSRLLLAVPAATALVFTGLSPAWAHDYGDGHGHGNGHERVSADVRDIDDDAWANAEGTRVKVTFEYKCEGDEEDIRVEVTLRQENGHVARFDTSFNGRHELDCDGDRHEKTVTLRDHGDRLRNDEAEVTVRFEKEHGGRLLDERTEDVDVHGVHRDRHHDRY